MVEGATRRREPGQEKDPGNTATARDVGKM
jgi:hypothetical protein